MSNNDDGLEIIEGGTKAISLKTLMDRIEHLQSTNDELERKLSQMVEAVQYAHDLGFEWPSDAFAGWLPEALAALTPVSDETGST